MPSWISAGKRRLLRQYFGDYARERGFAVLGVTNRCLDTGDRQPLVCEFVSEEHQDLVDGLLALADVFCGNRSHCVLRAPLFPFTILDFEK